MSNTKLPLTESDNLEFGVEYQGELHYSVVMRLTTVADNIAALEKVGSSNGLRLTMAMYALAIVSLGTIPKEVLTTEFLSEALADSEFDVLGVIQERLKKKRRRSSGALQDTGSPPSRSDSTASAKPPSAI